MKFSKRNSIAEIGHIIELNRNQPGTWWKSLLSLAGILVAATGLVTALQSSLNTVWKVKTLEGAFAIRFLWKRFISLAMILGFGFLLLVSFLVSTTLAALTHYVSSYFTFSGSIPNLLNQTVSLLTTWAFFTAIFRWMPDARVPWSHATLGGLLTVILFTIGRAALFFYLSTTNPAAQLGSAAGSLVVILLWIYYSSSILLLGAEFTASLTPFAIVPEQGAVRVEEHISNSKLASSPGKFSHFGAPPNWTVQFVFKDGCKIVNAMAIFHRFKARYVSCLVLSTETYQWSSTKFRSIFDPKSQLSMKPSHDSSKASFSRTKSIAQAADWNDHEHVSEQVQREAQKFVDHAGSPGIAKMAIEVIEHQLGSVSSKGTERQTTSKEEAHIHFLELLKDFETALETPVVSGDLMNWAETANEACTVLAGILCNELRDKHAELFARIGEWVTERAKFA